jgi:hypothetical protein
MYSAKNVFKLSEWFSLILYNEVGHMQDGAAEKQSKVEANAHSTLIGHN